MAHGGNGRNADPGTRAVLEELRDLRVEMRADRAEFRAEMRADRKRADEERRRSDERFERMMREFREDSVRRAAETKKAFREIRTVGLAIVKTLNRHTKILEHISEHHGRPDQGNGRGA